MDHPSARAGWVDVEHGLDYARLPLILVEPRKDSWRFVHGEVVRDHLRQGLTVISKELKHRGERGAAISRRSEINFLPHQDRDRDVRRDRDRDVPWVEDRDREFGRNRSRDDEHPHGWSEGRKRGWDDCDAPPGLAKKQGCKDREDVIFTQGHRAAPHPVNPAITRAEVARFDRYLDSHPAVARALERNPDLVRNQAFLARNPSLRTWLSTHPETAEEVRETPGQFLWRERAFEASQADRR